MSIESLVDRSIELRTAITTAPKVEDRIRANIEFSGFLIAVNEIIPIIGADAAFQILTGKKDKNTLAAIRARDKATSFQAMDGKRSPSEIDRRELLAIVDRLRAGIREAAYRMENYDIDDNLFNIQTYLEELLEMEAKA